MFDIWPAYLLRQDIQLSLILSFYKLRHLISLKITLGNPSILSLKKQHEAHPISYYETKKTQSSLDE